MPTKVILHCSDSSWGNAALITTWHLQNGWTTIGYSYVILNGQLAHDRFNHLFDGHIETGRPVDGDAFIDGDEIGAHARGYNRSVGICLIGQSNKFTDKQKHSVVHLVRTLKEQFGELEVVQHSDLDSKKPHCAGLPYSFMNLINKEL